MDLLDVPIKTDEEQIKEEYTSWLIDLIFNCKPLIDVLTMLARENQEYAEYIVAAIEEHLERFAAH